MATPESIAKSFVDFYYQTFDRSRQELAPLYKDHSMLTFEGQQFSGIKSIVEKLVVMNEFIKALPFQRVQHQVTTIDAQPSNPAAGPILVTVTGRLLVSLILTLVNHQVDDEKNPMNFSQTFQLVPDGGSFYIFNDIFRLNYGF